MISIAVTLFVAGFQMGNNGDRSVGWLFILALVVFAYFEGQTDERGR